MTGLQDAWYLEPGDVLAWGEVTKVAKCNRLVNATVRRNTEPLPDGWNATDHGDGTATVSFLPTFTLLVYRPGKLSSQQLNALAEVVREVADADRRYETANDFDGAERLVRQLAGCGVAAEDWERFVSVVHAVIDPDRRSPK